MKTYTYRIHLQPEPEGGYTVTVPALPGAVTWGKNYREALKRAQQCIKCHLEGLNKLGFPIPEEKCGVPAEALVEVNLPTAA